MSNTIHTLSSTTTGVNAVRMIEQMKLFHRLSAEEQVLVAQEQSQLGAAFSTLTLTKKTKNTEEKEEKADPKAQKLADWYVSLKIRNNKAVHIAALKALREGVDLTVVSSDCGVVQAASNLQRLSVLEAGTGAVHMTVQFAMLQQYRAWREATYRKYPNMDKKDVKSQFLEPFCLKLTGYSLNTLENRMTTLEFMEEFPRFQSAPISVSALKTRLGFLKQKFKNEPNEAAYWRSVTNLNAFSELLREMMGDPPAAPSVVPHPDLDLFDMDEDGEWAADFSTGSLRSRHNSNNDEMDEAEEQQDTFERAAERKASKERKKENDRKMRQAWATEGFDP